MSDTTGSVTFGLFRISFSDIGQASGGVLLTEPECQRVEDASAASAVALLRKAGVLSLAVAGLENTPHLTWMA